MNEDLEVIRTKYSKAFYISKAGAEIVDAAERMADEIEHYKGLAKRFEESYNETVTSLGDKITNMVDEIAHLKAELEVNAKTGEFLVGELRKHGIDINDLLFRLARESEEKK